MDAMELVFLTVLMSYVLLACLMWFVIGKMSKGAVILKAPETVGRMSEKMMPRKEVSDGVEGDIQGGSDGNP